MKYFFDTEFVENGYDAPIRLLSIGIVAEDGREYYAQQNYFSKEYPRPNDWVARNVFPHLQHFSMAEFGRLCDPRSNATARCWDDSCPWRLLSDLKSGIRSFCDPNQYGEPEFWGYYADYDWVVLCQLFGSMIALPHGWPMYCRDIKQWCDMLGNPSLPEQEKDEHHALADARWNKRAWEFLNEYAARK